MYRDIIRGWLMQSDSTQYLKDRFSRDLSWTTETSTEFDVLWVSENSRIVSKKSGLNSLGVWSWALLERSPVVRTLDSFPVFYGTQRFNTEFARAFHLSVSWARPIQSTSPHPTSTRSILILSTYLILVLPPTTYMRSSPPHSCYMPRPSHPPRLH
jgi:hypothetical protein